MVVVIVEMVIELLAMVVVVADLHVVAVERVAIVLVDIATTRLLVYVVVVEYS